MELKWEKRDKYTSDKHAIALTGVLKGKDRTLGWVMPRGWGFSSGAADGYEIGIAGMLHKDAMPCEEVRYVTLRQAMRTLKETVTILLIGRGYGT